MKAKEEQELDDLLGKKNRGELTTADDQRLDHLLEMKVKESTKKAPEEEEKNISQVIDDYVKDKKENKNSMGGKEI